MDYKLTIHSFGSVDDVLPYFERNGAAAPPNVNPAEFVLKTIGAGISGKAGTTSEGWASKWRDSQEAHDVSDAIQRIKDDNFRWEETTEIQETFNASTFNQSMLLTKRMLLNQWRKPAYIYSKIWVHVIQAILVGFTFFQLGTSPIDLQSR